MSDFAELVEQVRQEVRRTGDFHVRVANVAALIRSGTGRRWVGIYRVDEDVVTNLAWSGPAAPAYPTFPVTNGLTGAAIRSRKAVVANDVSNDPRYLTNQATTGSELIVPVLEGGTVVGTLDIEDERTDAFTEDDEARFEGLADALSDLYR